MPSPPPDGSNADAVNEEEGKVEKMLLNNDGDKAEMEGIMEKLPAPSTMALFSADIVESVLLLLLFEWC